MGQSETLSVSFPLSHCKRLCELLAADTGDLTGEFQLRRVGKQLRIGGRFSTQCTLECQRCLSQYTEAVEAEFNFVLVPDQGAADALPEEHDPLVLAEDGMLDVIDIFEDELILQLPTVPRHESVEACTFEVSVDIQPDAESAEAAGQHAVDNVAVDSAAVDNAAVDRDKAAAGIQRGEDVFAELKNLRFD